MDSFSEFKNAEAQLAELAEQLTEEKIPVQHATDGVAKVLGTKSAVKFLNHLRPGAEKHTSWDKVNTALTKQGVKTHHIAKIASHIKPAQYKEEAELGEEKDIVIRDKSGKVTKWSHEGDWRKSASGTTTDKSGAKHTPYSKARDLARTALKKTLTKEDTEQIDELDKSTIASYAKKSAAELPKHQANATIKHTGPIANAHAGKHPKTGESPIQWDDRKVKNRGAGIARAVDKLAKEEVELDEGKMGQLSADIGSHIDKHVSDYKAHGGAEHLMSKIDNTAKKIATQHGLEHKHAHKFVSDYVEKKLHEDVATAEYKVKKFIGHDGKTHERKVRPHIVHFKNSKSGGVPLTDKETDDKEVKESAPVATGVHRIGVTVSDPNHQAVTQRKEKVQKFVRIKGGSKEEALERGKKHFKSKGWKVHDAEHAGMVHEEVQIDELSNATLQSYKDKAMKSADELAAKGQHSKANDRYMKHMQASGKQIDRTMKNIHKAMQQRQNEDVELEEATQEELRAALNRHSERAVEANKRGDDAAVKMHQERMNKVKDKMAKLARNQ